tara:strand:- start:644 stop:1765 length:1122 start_codon:yes stop_codon:yes gene_type:complete
LVHLPFEIRNLASHVAGWLLADGPESDVVVSCRVRLARNLAGFAFQPKLDPDRSQELSNRLRVALTDACLDGETWWIPLEDASPVLRAILIERNLASRDLVRGGEATEPGTDAPDQSGRPGRAVAFGRSETVTAMVGEEDHLRLSALAAGLDLELAWQRVHVLDGYLEGQVEYSVREDLGYLTACPSNVGTGLRASVMLHLPALGNVRSELEKLFTAAQHTGLAVRGMQGEGSKAAGDLYQVSNQVTLGRTEAQLMEDLAGFVGCAVDFERKMRQTLLDARGSALRDRVARSYGLLRTSRAIPTEDALAHLSDLRLGLHLGLMRELKLEDLNRLALQIQKGHIHALTQADEQGMLDASERDKLRASLLRTELS